jgi:hypothetical protein
VDSDLSYRFSREKQLITVGIYLDSSYERIDNAVLVSYTVYTVYI